MSIASAHTSPPMPDSRRPELCSASAESVLRAASRTGSPARMARAAIVPPNAPMPTISICISKPPRLQSCPVYDRMTIENDNQLLLLGRLFGKVFAGKVTCGVRSETSGLSAAMSRSSLRYNPSRRERPTLAGGHTRYGTDEMDFDPVCVDDCRTVVHRAGDRSGEGSRRARQLGVRCDRIRLLVRMGGVHTACDWSGQAVPVDGAEVCNSYSDPHNHRAPDGSPGICHRILSEWWTSAVNFSHHRSWCAASSPDVHRQCSIDELQCRAYVLVSCRTVSIVPLLPGRDGAPDYSGATGDAALPRRT